ncbi:Fis family transcriptional regulator [Nocardiopsis sp. CNR-923]|uniref:PucR family transcriptional regulator ligand-binding domain-containing protein n=1 Tax=Nocardiopsis sp. CNR-923 TaxID=1904965 RepID=UPI0009633DE2|nr:PucR family transcriptional regulator ligand-binding domain-containing protein [Nocardiopsis sp. CNR-923]OLT28145.1 Fis family transcriptional regulator [Nocardiopsis sp. CNR-923]
MPPTLGALLRTPRLRLRLLTGEERLDRRVGWVAVSELTDPTPYLAGGELVLTTGVRWTDSVPDHRDYVRRLADRRVAGLGFGVGVVLEETPRPLREAAAEFGVPLVEVARETPFIAVGKEVSRLLAKEEYEGLTRAFAAQRELTRAALAGAPSIIDRLARDLHAWVLLLGGDGAVTHAAPAAARRHADVVAAELPRLRQAGVRASASVETGGQRVSVQPLATGRRARGYLAVGAGGPLGSDERTLVNAAVSLLSLELERGGRGPSVHAGEGVVVALLAGALDPLHEGAAPLREALPSEPVVVGVGAAAGAGHPPAGVLVAEHEGRALLLAEAATPGAVIRDVLDGPIGVSGPSGYADLDTALAEAERARAAALEGEGGVVRVGDLPGGLLGMAETPVGARMAKDLLRPLSDQRTGAELLASLRAYLASAGRWDAAAEALGVHRHTLRYRMTRIRDLLPGDLDDPDYRAELWIALRVRGVE